MAVASDLHFLSCSDSGHSSCPHHGDTESIWVRFPHCLLFVAASDNLRCPEVVGGKPHCVDKGDYHDSKATDLLVLHLIETHLNQSVKSLAFPIALHGRLLHLTKPLLLWGVRTMERGGTDQKKLNLKWEFLGMH